MTDQEIHLVPVPRRALPAVYQLLAELTRDATAENGVLASDRPSVSVRDNGAWSKSDLEALRAALKNPAGRAILDIVARNSTRNNDTTYEELRRAGEAATEGAFSYDQVRAQLSWIAKYSKKIKGDKVWPMTFEDRGPEVEKGERYRYRMPAELAQLWLDLTN